MQGMSINKQYLPTCADRGRYFCKSTHILLCERVTGRVVALKKSRVSRRVKRTNLEYEANILHLLAGHPSIPTIFAFGRLAHFEYIAIELLGPSLNDVLKEQGRFDLKSVLQIADQMVRYFLSNS